MVTPTHPVCEECGYCHPVAPTGCPMAKSTAKVETVDGKGVDLNDFLTKLRTILDAQIKMKQLDNPEKFLNDLLVKITMIAQEL